jgi:hypothetical protein
VPLCHLNSHPFAPNSGPVPGREAPR